MRIDKALPFPASPACAGSRGSPWRGEDDPCHPGLCRRSRPLGALARRPQGFAALRPGLNCPKPLRAPERARVRAHATPATFNACARIALIFRVRDAPKVFNGRAFIGWNVEGIGFGGWYTGTSLALPIIDGYKIEAVYSTLGPARW